MEDLIRGTSYHDLIRILNDINEIPNRFDELSEIQLEELKLLLGSKLPGLATKAIAMMEANPKYDYPIKYKNNKLDYWINGLSFHNMNYNQIKEFIEKIENRVDEIKQKEKNKLK